MEIVGYIASVLIGISLGLIGGGGSILTVPVLVYLFGVDPVLATAYSLFVVGVTSLVGAIPKYKEHLVDIRTGIVFGLPSIVAVFLTRLYVVPSIPDHLFTLGSIVVTKQLFILILFAMLMVFASISMIRGRKKIEENENSKIKFSFLLILAEGLLVGLLTGLVGAGGGFLIIPALVILTKLPMKTAVGTSLFIIALKSLIGFTGDLNNYTMDWSLLLIVTALSALGIFVGNILSRRIPGQKLKKGFGWFILVMGIWILFKELIV